MKASIRSKKTPKHLKAGLRKTIKKFERLERNEKK